MTNPYHIRGPNWKPKTKKDYIDLIVKSGYWTKTKKTLQDMDIKAVIQEYKIMLMKQQVDYMRKI